MDINKRRYCVLLARIKNYVVKNISKIFQFDKNCIFERINIPVFEKIKLSKFLCRNIKTCFFKFTAISIILESNKPLKCLLILIIYKTK